MATVIKNEVELARARLNGFMDAVNLIACVKLTEEQLNGVIKSYENIWLRHYLVEAGKSESATLIRSANE